ncbi:hypothetical protein [Tunturiibacter gelidiferens]|uniref:hypothetical protein n=1 Tax=Tunturiibacter gelidiferens TaxID=3069689 RepID=UPI003D9BF335
MAAFVIGTMGVAYAQNAVEQQDPKSENGASMRRDLLRFKGAAERLIDAPMKKHRGELGSHRA